MLTFYIAQLLLDKASVYNCSQVTDWLARKRNLILVKTPLGAGLRDGTNLETCFAEGFFFLNQGKGETTWYCQKNHWGSRFVPPAISEMQTRGSRGTI